jgi:hypothetical protein
MHDRLCQTTRLAVLTDEQRAALRKIVGGDPPTDDKKDKK